MYPSVGPFVKQCNLIEADMFPSTTGIKAKVENKGQYDEYLRDLKPIREELGVNLKEDLYPDPLYSGSVDAQAS